MFRNQYFCSIQSLTLVYMRVIILFSMLTCLVGCKSKEATIVRQSIQGTDCTWYGRYSSNLSDKKVNLISSASHGGFAYEDTLFVYVHTSPGNVVYLQAEINGVIFPKQFKVSGDEINKIEIPGKGKNKTWIFKTSEAHTGPLYIHKFEGKNLGVIEKPTIKKVEFIGNSITCGAASDESNMPCNEGSYNDHHNGYMSYASQTARRLDVDFVLSSISGAGIYRNWNSDGPTVPQLYSYLNLIDSTDGLWNPSEYQPTIILVALGTNDLSRGDGVAPRLPFDEEKYIDGYFEFLKRIIVWNTDAKIVLTDSPMISKDRDVLRRCLNEVKSKIDQTKLSTHPVEVFFYEPMEASGCLGHPSVEEHTLMSNQLTPFIQKMLN
jgi:lysophospholipase L1-like esterase